VGRLVTAILGVVLLLPERTEEHSTAQRQHPGA
jgi:hypothetical protein